MAIHTPVFVLLTFTEIISFSKQTDLIIIFNFIHHIIW